MTTQIDRDNGLYKGAQSTGFKFELDVTSVAGQELDADLFAAKVKLVKEIIRRKQQLRSDLIRLSDRQGKVIAATTLDGVNDLVPRCGERM